MGPAHNVPLDPVMMTLGLEEIILDNEIMLHALILHPKMISKKVAEDET